MTEDPDSALVLAYEKIQQYSHTPLSPPRKAQPLPQGLPEAPRREQPPALPLDRILSAQVTRAAQRLREQLFKLHPDDIGDGQRSSIWELLLALGAFGLDCVICGGGDVQCQHLARPILMMRGQAPLELHESCSKHAWSDPHQECPLCAREAVDASPDDAETAG